jgi:hypothetical protein
MTAPHYYASTSGIIVDRFLKYGLFPFSLMLGAFLTKTHDKATKVAQAICFAASAGITTTFLGLESHAIHDSAGEAVSAAMGVNPKDLEFSDYKHTSNIIARKAHDDLMRLQLYRYGTDMFFLLPMFIDTGYKLATGKELAASSAVGKTMESRSPDGGNKPPASYNPDRYSAATKFFKLHNGWAMSPYAGKAAYWFYETFSVPKTSYYEVVKVRENLEATGRDIRPDDIKAIYQRARTDRKLKMVSRISRKECDALRELCTRMADEYNKHDGTFGMNEIVYLIGENKFNIHKADGKTFSPEAVAQSHKELDKLLTIGLSGIREEIRHKHEMAQPPGIMHDQGIERTFVERISNKTVKGLQDILKGVHVIPRTPEEYLSPRDPTDLIGLSRD